MSSPFATTKEFMDAKGPIYTFANNSAVTTLFLLISLGITIYFFYASYAMHKDHKSGSQTTPMLGLLLVTGLATSLASSLFNSPQPPDTTTSQRLEFRQQTTSQQPTNQPIVLLLGLMSSAASVVSRPFGSRKSRLKNRYRR